MDGSVHEIEKNEKAPTELRTTLENSKIGIDRYTGHFSRRTSTTILSSCEEITQADIKRHGNWKSNSVPDRYQAVNTNTATKTALKIGEKLVEQTTNIQPKQKNQIENTEINPCKMFTNCMFNNCTINF